MQVYPSKQSRLPGTDRNELMKLARLHYHALEKQTKRQPYVKSVYFKNAKVFVNQFWIHLNQKNRVDQTRRLRLFPCALDLIRNCTYPPEITQKTAKPNDIFYRFTGKSREGELFHVQIRKNTHTRHIYFMSVFPGDEE